MIIDPETKITPFGVGCIAAPDFWAAPQLCYYAASL
jgi:hypothetical protein